MMRSSAPVSFALFTIGSLLGWVVDPVQAQIGAPQITEAHRQLVRWIGYSADGKSIATASFDGTLQIRDAGDGVLRKTLPGHRGQVFWGSFSGDGRIFASGGDDAVVRLWDVVAGRVRSELNGRQSAAWSGVVTPDGKRVISGGPDAMVVIWDVASEKAERSLRHTAPVWWIDVSSDSDSAAVAGADGKAVLYDLKTGKAQRTFGDHAGGIYCVAFSRDNTLIATAGADSQARIWHVETGKLKHTLPQFGAVHAVAFSPDGKRLATGGADYSVRLWNVDNGAFQAKCTGHRDAVWTIAFDPGGSHVASAGGDGKVLVWNLDDKRTAHAKKMPRQVDLRPILKRNGLPIVAQGSRNTCSVHTFTRGLEFAVSKLEKRGLRLSDEHLNWACNQVIANTGPSALDRGQFFEHLWMGYCKHGICKAEAMPFSQQFNPLGSPSAAAVQSAQEMRKYSFVWRDISGPGVPDEVVVSEAKSVLARGWPLLAGSSHSLFVVGYVDRPNGGFFIVADSGTGTFIDRITGDRLHSAIPYARVKDYGFSWIECLAAPQLGRDSSSGRNS